MRVRGAAFLLLALVMLGACQTAPAPEPFPSPPATDELGPEEQRVWEAARRTAETLERVGSVLPDPELERYATEILDAVYPELAGSFRARVLAQPVVNAIALADGSIYLFTGIVARLENEAQLASVLAHEGAHFAYRHSYADRTRAHYSLIDSALRRSRDQELEADRIGLERMAAAGYAPAEAVRALEHLVEIESVYGTEVRSSQATHPGGARRVAEMAALVAEFAPGGRIGREEYLRRTARTRLDAVEEALARCDHRLVLLALEDGGAADGYPAYVDYYLGQAYRLRDDEGDTERAEAAYLRAIERAPSFAPAHRALGRHYLKGSRPEPAARHLERYLELAPDATDRAFVEADLERVWGEPR